jgi:hypothetical protein
MRFLIWPVIWIASTFIAAAIVDRMGKLRRPGCMPILLLAPLGLVMLGVAPPAHAAHTPQQTPRGELKTCRFCSALIPAKSRVCRYCSRDLPPDRHTAGA